MQPNAPEQTELPKPDSSMSIDDKTGLLHQYIITKKEVGGLDFSSVDYGGLNPEGASLEGINLQRAKLYNSHLQGANLENANLREANLREANLREANLQNANLQGADLEDAYLQGANLQGANLQGARLHNAIMSGSNLQGATMDGVLAENVDLTRADLRLASVVEADLTSASLRETRADGASFQESNLRRATLRDARLCGANLQKTNLEESSLSDCDLSEANLWGASLQKTSMSRVNLDNSNMGSANLMGARILETSLERSSNLIAARVNGETYARSSWLPEYLTTLVERGLAVVALQGELAKATKPSLTLFFSNRLPLLSRATVEATLGVLAGNNRDCSCTYTTGENGATVELSGLPLEELAEIATQLHAFFDRPTLEQVREVVREDGGQTRQELANTEASLVYQVHQVGDSMLQQLGQEMLQHIQNAFEQVSHTQIKLSPQVTEALRSCEDSEIQARLPGALGWTWQPESGTLFREGAWTVQYGSTLPALPSDSTPTVLPEPEPQPSALGPVVRDAALGAAAGVAGNGLTQFILWALSLV